MGGGAGPIAGRRDGGGRNGEICLSLGPSGAPAPSATTRELAAGRPCAPSCAPSAAPPAACGPLSAPVPAPSPPDAPQPPADVPPATASVPRPRPPGGVSARPRWRDARAWRRHTGALAPPVGPGAPRAPFRAARVRTPFPGGHAERRSPGAGQVPFRRPGSPALPGLDTATWGRRASPTTVSQPSGCAPSLSRPPSGPAGLGVADGPRTALLF